MDTSVRRRARIARQCARVFAARATSAQYAGSARPPFCARFCSLGRSDIRGLSARQMRDAPARAGRSERQHNRRVGARVAPTLASPQCAWSGERQDIAARRRRLYAVIVDAGRVSSHQHAPAHASRANWQRASQLAICVGIWVRPPRGVVVVSDARAHSARLAAMKVSQPLLPLGTGRHSALTFTRGGAQFGIARSRRPCPMRASPRGPHK